MNILNQSASYFDQDFIGNTVKTNFYLHLPDGLDALPLKLKNHYDQHKHDIQVNTLHIYHIYVLITLEDGYHYHIGYKIRHKNSIQSIACEDDINKEDCVTLINHLLTYPYLNYVTKPYGHYQVEN